MNLGNYRDLKGEEEGKEKGGGVRGMEEEREASERFKDLYNSLKKKDMKKGRGKRIKKLDEVTIKRLMLIA